VSRGGEKLDAALERFDVDVAGRRCLDAGASTGGFTDCLLQRGAAEVVAVDVGYGQLHERLRSDERVRNLERTNVRAIEPATIGGPVAVTVADLSFISLRTVLPALLAATEPEGDLVLLVKPQFEAGRQEASRGKGVIRDPAVWRRVLEDVRSAAVSQGATMMEAMASPLQGADGNVEFLVRLSPRPLTSSVDLDAVIAGAPGD
jgi:23S rRNA (cytidine1920-2'-O)/16S rRNA (cytidine1409-2'-O)-methyltransferase